MLTNILCFCVCLLVVLTQKLDLEENDICKQQGDELWTCQRLSQCPTAQEELKKGKRPQTCSYIDRESVVCCQPALLDRRPQNTISKSKRKCMKYAESVFLSPSTNGTEKVDKCALVEPIGMVHTVTEDIPVLSINAKPREFPHIAVIGYGNKTNKRPSARCVGNLISDRYVLSLASCSEIPTGHAAWVRLGDYNVNSDEDEKTSDSRVVIYDIASRINHPEYVKPGTNEIGYNNIALYLLKKRVKFDEYIRPICLYEEALFTRSFATTTGWGPVELGEKPSDVLQKVNVTITDNKTCSDAYKFNGVHNDGLNLDLTVCAALVNGYDPCMSTPGSPLQIRVQDPYCMYRLVGLKYLGRACFVKAPGVYTRISYYLDWIESIVWP